MGNYRISPNEGFRPETCPISKEISKKYLALPIMICIGLSMFLVNLLLPAASLREQIAHVFLWILVIVLTLAFTFVSRHKLVDVPRLCAQVKYGSS